MEVKSRVFNMFFGNSMNPLNSATYINKNHYYFHSTQENDVIRLLSRVDDNWYEGMLTNGRTGYIPKSYVEVKIPLP